MSNITPVDELKSNLSKMESQFKMALPKHIPAERFMRVIFTAIGQTPALSRADRQSFYAACMKSAQAGLLPDGKEAAIVTFKNKSGQEICQFMPMVAGILKQVRNSGELASITSQLVYEKDDFKYWIDGEGEHLEHKPNIFDDRGKLRGVYALAKMKDGSVYIEVLTSQQVEAIKKSSRSAGSGPWAGAFEAEMWRKSAIRRLSKRLPLSTDIEMTIKADDDFYDLEGKEQAAADAAALSVSTKKPARLGKLVKGVKSKEETEVLPPVEQVETEVVYDEDVDQSDLPI